MVGEVFVRSPIIPRFPGVYVVGTGATKAIGGHLEISSLLLRSFMFTLFRKEGSVFLNVPRHGQRLRRRLGGPLASRSTWIRVEPTPLTSRRQETVRVRVRVYKGFSC
jgi:hypothetical protein